jgi:hypothetical protein
MILLVLYFRIGYTYRFSPLRQSQHETINVVSRLAHDDAALYQALDAGLKELGTEPATLRGHPHLFLAQGTVLQRRPDYRVLKSRDPRVYFHDLT